MADDCIFCGVRDGNVPGDLIYKDDNCFVIRDIAPQAPVHLLVIPNLHFTFLSGLTSEHHDMVGGMYQTAHEVAKTEGLVDSGYRLVVNQGADAGQVVDHLHMHVLGGRTLQDMG